MDVRGHGAADAEIVGTRLLLPDRPGSGCEGVDERRPLDAGLDLDQPALLVDREDPGERSRVEQDTARAELLAAHRMPSARDGHGPAG